MKIPKVGPRSSIGVRARTNADLVPAKTPYHDTKLDIVSLGTHRLRQWLAESIAEQEQKN